ncbi:hypothetical protein ASPCAL01690 [Aspergillus calidoustus]|uniref:Uncharacterized protein n=1 Tax=Aspergillus calidoustus TaxID=454130 RepID=A0A0U5GN81_ASPCI|nr:hypothetical protein ASPCAL01690 [Aspergillus calidoustus]
MSNEQIESHPSEELGRSFRVDLIQMARALNEAQVRHLVFGYSAVSLLPDDPGHDGSGVYHEIELAVPRDKTLSSFRPMILNTTILNTMILNTSLATIQ